MRKQLFLLPYKKQSFLVDSLLSGLSLGYKLGSLVASQLYSKEELALPVPVISIGSIVAGGSGKTPFVALLAEELKRPLAILSHGYRAKKTGRVEGVEYGDEAFLLQKKLPFAQVFSGKDRIANATLALEEEIDLCILDSGMQVRGLRKDIEIAVIHYDNLWHHWHYLPKGLLRESPSRLKWCDMIVVHGATTADEFVKAENFLRKYSQAPVIGVKSCFKNGEEIQGKKVGVFTGIGHPEPFYQMIREAKGTIVFQETLSDHEALENPELFIKKAREKGADLVVCTEKDAIKLRDTSNIFSLTVEMKVIFGKEIFALLLDRIKTLIIDAHETRCSSSQARGEYP